ncbi:MAG TPA: nucleotidyltransferase family protein [Longimicrobiales bacterium]|nr:nucleotidyltransferase family protein [Longimicrobiales bacterium]
MKASARVAAIVLGAGSGTRFGSTKQLALLDGRPLIRVAVESILGYDLDEVVVVLGHDADAIRPALERLPVRIVMNERFAEGLATSLAAGVAALEPGIGAALVVLGDQPVPAGVVERLIARWRDDAGEIVAPAYRGTRGNPVLFDAALFTKLTRLRGDRGARDLIDASPWRTTIVDFDVAAPTDVDRPADLDAER